MIIINIIICLGLYVYIYLEFADDNKSNVIEEIAIESIEKEEPVVEEKIVEKTINVEIKGAVKKAGVYTFKENTIINDAIKKAGGFQKNAYSSNINLSKHLKDEMVIYVYSKSTWEDMHKENEPEIIIKQEECICETVEIPVCEEKGESIIVVESHDDNISVEKEETSEEQKNDKPVQDGLININTASLEELKTLTNEVLTENAELKKSIRRNTTNRKEN